MTAPEQYYRLLNAVIHALTKTIQADSPGAIFEAMLEEVLVLTGSSYGFMGEVLTDPKGTPFLKTHALSNIVYNEETRKLYDTHLAGGLEFRNLDTLFGRVLLTGEPVIINDPGHGSSPSRLPPGHPPLSSFLGLPLHNDGALVGMIGMANRPDGYDQECLDLLQPLLSPCATIITSFRTRRQRAVLEEELRSGSLEWGNIFQAIGDYALILDDSYTILEANRAVSIRTGISTEHLKGRKCHEIFHNTSAPPDDCPLQRQTAESVGSLPPSPVHTVDGVFLVNCTPVRDQQGKITKIIHIATDITPLHNAQRELAESEARLKMYFDKAPVGLAVLDRDLRFVRINALMADMNGIPAAQHIGRTVRDILPDVAEPAEAIAAQVIATGRAMQNIELTGETPAKPGYTETWLENWFPFTDFQGAVAEFLVIAQDITDRKKAENDIFLHRQRLQSLINVLEYPAVKTQDFLDKALEEALALTESELGYIYFYHARLHQFELNSWSKNVMRECDIMVPQTIYELDKTGLWGEAVRQGKPIMVNDFAAPHPLKKGQPEGHARLDRFLTVPIFSSQDTIAAVIGVANKLAPYTETDTLQLTLLMDSVWKVVLQRQDQERILRLNRILRIVRDINQLILRENNVEQLLNTACELLLEHGSYQCAWLLLCDESGNPVLSRQIGFREEAQGFSAQTIGGFMPPCLAMAREQAGVFQVRDRDAFCALCPAATFYPDKQIMCGSIRHGTIVHGYMMVILDNLNVADSDERQLLSDLADDLGYALHNLRQQRALARAETQREEMEARLRQSQKLEAIGTLAGGIAHDFNNILSAILGYADLVRAEVGAREPAADDIAQVIGSANRAAGLVRQILTLSRQTEQHLQPVRVQHITKEACKLLRPTIPAIIDLHTTFGGDIPPTLADPTEIHQILMNLATNASHAMSVKGGVLKIDLACVELDPAAIHAHYLKLVPGRYILLTVSDTGTGMDSTTRAKIFEPYFTTKKKGEGLDLAWRWSTASLPALAAISPWRANRGKVPGSGFICPCIRSKPRGPMRLRKKSSPCPAGRSGSWWWTTKRPSPSFCNERWPNSAIR